MYDEALNIKRIIFCELDAVLGGLIMSTIIKPKYGMVDVLHDIIKTHSLSEYEDFSSNRNEDGWFLSLAESDIICTCWSPERTLEAVRWAFPSEVDQTRIYTLGQRHFKPPFDVPPSITK